MPMLGVAMTTASILISSCQLRDVSSGFKSRSRPCWHLLGDPVHVGDLFLVTDDLDGRPHVLDHLGVRLPLLHHA